MKQMLVLMVLTVFAGSFALAQSPATSEDHPTKDEAEVIALNRTTRHWHSVKLCENTLAATLRANGKGSTASEKVYESSVV